MNYVLIGILAFLIFCVVWIKFPHMEGFKSGNTPKDIYVKIQNSNTELNDALNLATYRSSYEDSILELEKWADNSMLNIISQGKLGTDSVDKEAESIRTFNDLSTFKRNLKDIMNVLDKTE